MWFCPDKYKIHVPNINKELLEIEGDIADDEKAKITLVKFLRANLGFTVELISGIRLAPYQEIILKGLFNRNFCLSVLGRGGSKTLDYEGMSYVYEKDKGLILLKDLFPNLDFSQGDVIKDIPNVNLWNGKSWQQVSKLIIQPKKKCLKIKTSYGYFLTGSENHLIKALNTQNDNCNITWKRYNELKIGDAVCISRNKIDNFNNITKEEEDESYLIGLLIGDGCISPNNTSTTITSIDKEIIDFCVSKGAKISGKKGTEAKTLRFSNVYADYILNKYSLKRNLSYTKEIPASILNNQSRLKQCLMGIFDTDGTTSISKGLISVCSTSEILINQIQIALLSFGIISSIKQIKTNSKFGKAFILKITGKSNIEKFRNEIGFKLPRKQNILTNYLNLNVKTNLNKDVIYGAKEKLKKIIDNSYLSKEARKFHHDNIEKRDQDNLTYQSLDKYISFCKTNQVLESDLKYLEEIQDENFYFDKIVSIETCELNCIDFNIPNGECYWSNGFISHNSFIAAVYCFLQCIFEPNSKIIVAGPTFRTARLIFTELEKMVNSKNAQLLRDCFDIAPSKRNDIFEWQINGGMIRAIPLNGEKIRGFRANILVLDEFLLLSEDTVRNVLMPFLTSPQNVAERIKIREMEDELIRKGALKESERLVFPNNSKMICMSSASYTFENLYKTYRSWIDKIEMPLDEEKRLQDIDMPDLAKDAPPKYFVAQMGYEAFPKHMVDPTIIQEAKNGGTNNSSFLREYAAQFTDGSDSYFSAIKMRDCTIEDGSSTTTELVGQKGADYILAIDPSFSNSPSSDHFAMNVLKMNHEDQKPTLVHSYAVAGGDLKDHHKYLYYLLNNFNIVFIIIDNAGGEFLDSANESSLFKNNGKEIKFLDFDTALEGSEYLEAVKRAKGQYNKEAQCIAVKQFFSTAWIRRANEHLKGLIDYKKIWFASKLNLNGSKFDEAIALDINLDLIPHKSIIDFIDFQDDWIHQTKKQCALIEVKTNPQGSQSFDLPANLKRSNRADKARKDSYTALLLGAWANKCYYDIVNYNSEPVYNFFEPYLIGRR